MVNKSLASRVSQWASILMVCEKSVHMYHNGTAMVKYFPRYWPFFRVTTGHRWIPLAKASGAELWRFLWSAPEQTVDQTAETPVIRDAITLIMTSL